MTVPKPTTAQANRALRMIGFGHLHITGNWSSSVTVKQDHTLIRTGPYTVVRHPIYSGLILAIFGTALALGEFRDLLAVGVLFATFLIKSRTEERFMTEQFGHDYEHYRHETKALIPFIF